MAQMQVLKAQVKKSKAEEFKKTAMDNYGYSKGTISKALNEAIAEWIKKRNTKKSVKASELTGIASELKDSSLKAQKKATKIFMGKN